MNNLQRMIVIPPEIFEKFKHLVLEDEQLTDLDKMMKSILYNKKLNDLNKWHLYRQNLIKYSSMKRKNAHETKFKWPVKHVEGVAVQTRKIYTKDQTTKTNSPKVAYKQSQTDGIRDEEEYTNDVAMDEVFENNDEEVQSENDNVDNDDDADDSDNNIINKDQILRRRESSGYMTYETQNGDVITVPSNSSPKTQVKPLIQKPKDGSKQTTISFPHRKSSRIAANKTFKRTKSERTELSWTPFI